MTVEEALRRAIARIPALENGPLTVGIEVDRFGNATATLDFEMTEEQLLRSYATVTARKPIVCRVLEARSWLTTAKKFLRDVLRLN